MDNNEKSAVPKGSSNPDSQSLTRPTLSGEHDDLNTQYSNRPSDLVPAGLLWIMSPSCNPQDCQAEDEHISQAICEALFDDESPITTADLLPEYDNDTLGVEEQQQENYYSIPEEDSYDIFQLMGSLMLNHDEQHALLGFHDIDAMSYEQLLELEATVGDADIGICSSKVHEFVKAVTCSGNRDEEERCTICLDGYQDGELMGQLSCRHSYHFSCIARWLEEKPSCPICKRSPGPLVNLA